MSTKQLSRHVWFQAFAFVFAFCYTSDAIADGEKVRAAALLQRALDSRESNANFALTFRHQQHPTGPVDCQLDISGEMFRCEGSGSDGNLISAAFWDGRYVWEYSPGANEVARKSEQLASQKGVFLFDPRTIGLVSVFGITKRATENLSVGDKEFDFRGESTIDGTDCGVVRIIRGILSVDTYVNEPTGRVLKVEIASISPNLKHDVDIVSKFVGTSEGLTWLPASVEVSNNGVREWLIDEIQVTDTHLEPKRFELAGLAIPPGTPVIDYDEQHRIGYWDGNTIVDDYSPAITLPEKPSRSFLVLGALAAFTVIAIVFYRKLSIAEARQ